MYTRAAIATAAGEPLAVDTVKLDGPREGEAMVEIMATGVCHTDAYTLSGADPEGLFPAILGARRGRRGRGSGSGGEQRGGGRPCDSAVHAGVPRVQVLHLGQDEPVRGHPRDPGPRRDAGRHVAVLAWGRDHPALHGHVHVLQLHGGAGDRAGEDSPGRALRQGLLHRLRGHHRPGGGDEHGQGGIRRHRRRVRAGRHRPECRPRGASARRNAPYARN